MDFLGQVLYEFSSWFVSKGVSHPRTFTITVWFLLAYFIINNWRLISKYLGLREELIKRIIETRRQARAHQNTNHAVDHALEPHKKEKREYLREIVNELSRLDPWKVEAEHLMEDLSAATTFKQSEEVTTRFLIKYRKI